mmetsp:Transcript_59189/g.157536  ORF Transcript_59189/g.157536 Transcript_59189/m.157536 type:complete len:745 (-) Transcript_59189:424-2658(-)|eukprot:CAMPEP_0194478686 /NCGR_PEP_ID=MMETSP0253-20130528/2045_1 /TAXON_ID=2966 /ORGANISM="Noctiluca scintillans" /LENGTH=744 /DNA_ID=CAMNT_0039317801 /DNA_START=50 /DNA_END=2284 /DNA_ORIENTATION=+
MSHRTPADHLIQSYSAVMKSAHSQLLSEVINASEVWWKVFERELGELFSAALDAHSVSVPDTTALQASQKIQGREAAVLRRNLIATSDALILLAQRTSERASERLADVPAIAHKVDPTTQPAVAALPQKGLGVPCATQTSDLQFRTDEHEQLAPDPVKDSKRKPKQEPHALKDVPEESRRKLSESTEEAPSGSPPAFLKSSQTQSFDDREGASRYQIWILDLVENPNCDNFFSLLIVLNILNMGLQAHFQVSDGSETGVLVLEITEVIFTICFMTELYLRVVCYGCRIYCPRDKRGFLNMVDLMVVIVTFFLSIVMPITGALTGISFDAGFLSYITILRAFRLLRLVRVLRKSIVLREVYFMLQGLTDSFGLLVWTILVIFCITYLWAVFGLVFISGTVKDMWHEETDIDQKNALKELFGYLNGIDVLMFTLIQVLTLDSWTGIVRPLVEHVWWSWVYFYGFIAVADLVLMNLITAMIVDTAVSKTANDQENAMRNMEKSRMEELQSLQDIFTAMDTNGDGSLSWDEFEDAFEDDTLHKRWLLLDVKRNECERLFHLLDTGDGMIQTEEFFEGMKSMKGPAMSKDLFSMNKSIQKLQHKLNVIQHCVLGGEGSDFTPSSKATSRAPSLHFHCQPQPSHECAKSDEDPVARTSQQEHTAPHSRTGQQVDATPADKNDCMDTTTVDPLLTELSFPEELSEMDNSTVQAPKSSTMNRSVSETFGPSSFRRAMSSPLRLPKAVGNRAD